jgi:hypothetical protein
MKTGKKDCLQEFDKDINGASWLIFKKCTKMKKLAVLLPTYNAATYLKESIDSVLNETFGDF